MPTAPLTDTAPQTAAGDAWQGPVFVLNLADRFHMSSTSVHS